MRSDRIGSVRIRTKRLGVRIVGRKVGVWINAVLVRVNGAMYCSALW